MDNSSNTKILDGKAYAKQLRELMRIRVAAHVEAGGQSPGLAVVVVGDDAASQVYVRNKREACTAVGIHSELYALSSGIETDDVLEIIDQLNTRKRIHGILVQLPLPDHLDSQRILERIDDSKDVDGFHAINMGRLALRDPGIRPCTPRGIMALLHHHGLSTRGKHAVVVGASNIVGRPMALELLLDGATITVCHRFTNDLQHHVEQADILVSAVGKMGIVDANWIKPDCIVVDVAMNRTPDGVLCGDLDQKIVQQKASWYTPVPGGVGPMTVAMLLNNTMLSAGITLSELS